MRSRLLQLHFFLKACVPQDGWGRASKPTELLAACVRRTSLPEEASLRERQSPENSRGSLVYAERGMQVIEERLYREVLVVDKRRLYEETASFRRLPFCDPFASRHREAAGTVSR